MFECLSQVDCEQMSDRELSVSEVLYRSNLSYIRNEMSKRQATELVKYIEPMPDSKAGNVEIKSIAQIVPIKQIKKRGRKKKVA